MSTAVSRPEPEGLFVPVVPEAAAAAGKFGILERLRILFTFARNPLAGFTAAQFEKPFDQFEFFGRQATVVNDPRLIQHFFVENTTNYRYGDIRQALLKPALRDGLLTAEGDTWRKARRTMAPVFTPRNVQSFARSMRLAGERCAEEIVPGPARIAPAMCKLAFHVLSQTLFSGELSANAEEMLSDTEQFLRTLGHPDPFDILGLPDWVPRLSKLRGGASIRRLRSRVRERIEDRASRLQRGDDVPRDFATLLLGARGADGGGFSHDQIEDHLLTFIGAGHETVARALAWTLYLLANDSQALARAREEADRLDVGGVAEHEWPGRLPFVCACFEEGLRLFPPVSHVVRIAMADNSCDGVFVPAGSTMVINIWMLHRHRLRWRAPDAFDPDRFMAPRRETIDRFAFLPFGVGPHVCIGASFATQELAILLAILLRRFDFEYAGDGPPQPVTHITTQPHNGMPMIVRAR